MERIFNNKETNNWFKAFIALNFTKEGLTSLVDTELQNVHKTVGTSCGKCTIERILPCPTKDLCRKIQGNVCTFHLTQPAEYCKTCDSAKQNIISLHRFSKPSWKNTNAQSWQTDYWEIGKCFLPPDGYSSVPSIWKADFNGIISILLNCKHFEICLSSSLSPKPPDPNCPLEKARQISRDLRHTADCKVSDADLQDYFQTLSNLLADPIRLLQDVTSAKARSKLSDLQNDRMSITELGEILKDAKQTIENAKDIGKSFADEAETTLTECLRRLQDMKEDCKNELAAYFQDKKREFNAEIEKKKKDSGQTIYKRTEHDKQSGNEKTNNDYESNFGDLLDRLKSYYDHLNRLNHVPISPLSEGDDEKLMNVYSTPKLLLSVKENGAFETGNQVTEYKEILLANGKLNRLIFIQGDAGSGKSTFAAKLVLDWCGKTKIDSDTAYFNDLTILQEYVYVFFITLRDSLNATDVITMIREQLIDSIYSAKDRLKAYNLLDEIMEKENGLAVLDGLDEWSDPEGKYALPKMVNCHRQCTLLVTTRPWKLADGKIPNSQIDILMTLEGLNDPFELSRNILRTRDDCKEDESLKHKQSTFKSYIEDKQLAKLLRLPMMLSLIVHSWEEGVELQGSQCQIYCRLLESLLRKANTCEEYFEQTPFPCFTESRFIKPNIEHLERLSEAAFYLLFCGKKETSLVFSSKELQSFKFHVDRRIEFALKAGILTKTRRPSVVRTSSSFSFIHKAIQEFLAAFHIAKNTKAIDEVILEYLRGSEEFFVEHEFSQIFLFLCGLNISAANALSKRLIERIPITGIDARHFMYQNIILDGYSEALANNLTDINLSLESFVFLDNNVIDLQGLWEINVSRVVTLGIGNLGRNSLKLVCKDSIVHCVNEDAQQSPSFLEVERESTTCFELDLSKCDRLERIYIFKGIIVLPDVESLARMCYWARVFNFNITAVVDQVVNL